MMLLLVVMVSVVVVDSNPVREWSWEREVDRVCPNKWHNCKCEPQPKQEVYVTCKGTGLLYVSSELPWNTTRLDISNNNFKSITQATFRNVNTPKLRMLYMRNCSIENIDENSFFNTTYENSVRHIDLSHNALKDTKTIISVFKRFKRLIFLDVTHNTCIDCSELTKELGDNVKIIRCNNTHNSCSESTTTESAATNTTSMIRLNHTQDNVSTDNSSYYDVSTSTSYPISLSNSASLDALPQTPIDNDSDMSAKWYFETGFFVGSGVVLCSVVVIVFLVYFLNEKKILQSTSKTPTQMESKTSLLSNNSLNEKE